MQAQHSAQLPASDRGRGAQEECGGDGPCFGSRVALEVPTGLAVIQNQCGEGTHSSLRAEGGWNPSSTSRYGFEEREGKGSWEDGGAGQARCDSSVDRSTEALTVLSMEGQSNSKASSQLPPSLAPAPERQT